MNRILIVEDDDYLRQGLAELLGSEGYAVESARNCEEARSLFTQSPFELVLLDFMLPDGTGMELCREFRSWKDGFSIMFLTVRDDEWEIVRGLDAGADDYLTKPFRTMELLSRVRALLRRYNTNRFETGSLTLDLERMSVVREGNAVYLTPTEFMILKTFLQNPGRTLTRRMLLESIWDEAGNYIDDNTLSVHISRLREKIGSDFIATVRGIGYRWEEKK